MKLKEKNFDFRFDKAYIEYNDIIIASASNVNGLFEVSTKEQTCKYLTLFNDEPSNKTKLFSDVVKCGEKLFFVPYSAKKIAIYNMKASELSYLDIDIDDQPKENSDAKFGVGILNGQDIYMIGSKYAYIMKICTRTNEIEYYSIPEENIEWDSNVAMCCNQIIYVLSSNRERYIVFNMQNGSITIQKEGADQIFNISNEHPLKESLCDIRFEVVKNGERYWEDVYKKNLDG